MYTQSNKVRLRFSTDQNWNEFAKTLEKTISYFCIVYQSLLGFISRNLDETDRDMREKIRGKSGSKI